MIKVIEQAINNQEPCQANSDSSVSIMFYKDIQGKQSRSGQLNKWNVVEILNYYAPDIMNDGKYSLINS